MFVGGASNVMRKVATSGGENVGNVSKTCSKVFLLFQLLINNF